MTKLGFFHDKVDQLQSFLWGPKLAISQRKRTISSCFCSDQSQLFFKGKRTISNCFCGAIMATWGLCQPFLWPQNRYATLSQTMLFNCNKTISTTLWWDSRGTLKSSNIKSWLVGYFWGQCTEFGSIWVMQSYQTYHFLNLRPFILAVQEHQYWVISCLS